MKVLFVKEPIRNAVLAVFPFTRYNNGYRTDLVTCYSHVGQHSYCAKEFYKPLRKAKKSEYMDLLRELEQIGYKLDVMNEQDKVKKEK
jgi:hypothetical protein